MQINIELNKQFIRDVFVTALEGGIGYWSEWDEYRPGVEDFHAVIREVENEHTENNRYRIDAAVIGLGCKRFIEEPFDGPLATAIIKQDAGGVDSLGADVIVQLGLFGEVRYG